MNHTSAAALTDRLPILPPELIDEIFLDSSRPALYSTIDYHFLSVSNPYTGTTSYKLASITSQILETLQSSSKVREMVKTLRLAIPNIGQDGPEYPSLHQPAIELLELLKNVTRLKLRDEEFDGVLEYVCTNGARWKELEIWNIESGLNLASDKIFPNLTKLSCFKLYSSDTTRSIYLPPCLTMLEVRKTHSDGPITIANVHESPLQSLLLRLDLLLNLPDVSKLPKLQHLHLRNVDGLVAPQQVVNFLNTCQSLTSLWLDVPGSRPRDHFFDLLRGISVPHLFLSFQHRVPNLNSPLLLSTLAKAIPSFPPSAT
ncbi:hypothetical protein JCM5350_001353 [Sporobolomyces pararoseus]